MGIFNFVKAGGKKFGSIVGTGAKVNKTKLDEAKSNLNIAIQKTKGAKGKLKQTLFEIKNKQPLTFKSQKGIKTKSNTELKKEKKVEKEKNFKKTMDDNKKAITRIFNAPKNFNKGGRVGLKFGSKKSNVQKIKETFNPKKSTAKKRKNFSGRGAGAALRGF